MTKGQCRAALALFLVARGITLIWSLETVGIVMHAHNRVRIVQRGRRQQRPAPGTTPPSAAASFRGLGALWRPHQCVLQYAQQHAVNKKGRLYEY
ncbi:hypothetical protein A9Q02_22135 [Candidatus Chloroploca asiatica]|uniref:Uncharacterized protein n=1 Tax=Candidatus Chloroploca asiatica TaxID=1506545 RepID=A0A2H3KPT4_9CHLR|nr:hypothetical protein A9Q02_22135 [Candidatus Chloroploca asiatica]